MTSCVAPVARPAVSLRCDWIIDRRSDLLWLVGGAAGGYAMFYLHAGLHADMLVVWFWWFVLLDSPHFFATYARTYLDGEERRKRRSLLLGSLALFLIGPAVLVVSRLLFRRQVGGSNAPLLVLVGLVQLWAYWHVVRQHYGILALYQRKGADTAPADRRIDAALLYVGTIAPVLAFGIRHPEVRAALGLATAPSDPTTARIVCAASAAVVVTAVLVFAARQAQRRRRGLSLNLPKLLFLAAVVSLHSLVCYHPAALTAPLLAFGAFVTVFHDVQYHAIVRFYQTNCRGRVSDERNDFQARLRRSFGLYASCALAQGAIFGFLGCALDLFPGCAPRLQTASIVVLDNITMRDVLACVFLGFTMHHYLLDQFIWRPSRDARLRRRLNLA